MNGIIQDSPVAGAKTTPTNVLAGKEGTFQCHFLFNLSQDPGLSQKFSSVARWYTLGTLLAELWGQPIFTVTLRLFAFLPGCTDVKTVAGAPLALSTDHGSAQVMVSFLSTLLRNEQMNQKASCFFTGTLIKQYKLLILLNLNPDYMANTYNALL